MVKDENLEYGLGVTYALTSDLIFFQKRPYKDVIKNTTINKMAKKAGQKPKTQNKVIVVKFNYDCYKSLKVSCNEKELKFQCLGIYIQVSVKLLIAIKAFLF